MKRVSNSLTHASVSGPPAAKTRSRGRSSRAGGATGSGASVAPRSATRQTASSVNASQSASDQRAARPTPPMRANAGRSASGTAPFTRSRKTQRRVSPGSRLPAGVASGRSRVRASVSAMNQFNSAGGPMRSGYSIMPARSCSRVPKPSTRSPARAPRSNCSASRTSAGRMRPRRNFSR